MKGKLFFWKFQNLGGEGHRSNSVKWSNSSRNAKIFFLSFKSILSFLRGKTIFSNVAQNNARSLKDRLGISKPRQRFENLQTIFFSYFV